MFPSRYRIVSPHFQLPLESVGHDTRSNPKNDFSALSLSSAIETISSNPLGNVPVIQGWGGVTLDGASNGQMQLTMLRSTSQDTTESEWDSAPGSRSALLESSAPGTRTGSNQTIQLAQQYNMWVVLDYHSYSDLVDSTCQAVWLSFWKGVLSTNWNYDRIVWEPINEPAAQFPSYPQHTRHGSLRQEVYMIPTGSRSRTR